LGKPYICQGQLTFQEEGGTSPPCPKPNLSEDEADHSEAKLPQKSANIGENKNVSGGQNKKEKRRNIKFSILLNVVAGMF